MLDSNAYLSRIRNHKTLTAADQRRLILSLSWPAILAQISVTVMQLIDSSMVGQLGTNASASIGLVASSTWLINGLASGFIFGFSVQTSQAIGAQDLDLARNLCRQGLLVILSAGMILMGIGASLCEFIPVWLGGEEAILRDASSYLLIFCFSLPFSMLNNWAVQMLQGAGDTRVPGLTQIVMCLLDVVFNWFFIYKMNLGVLGAALGTGSSVLVASLFLSFWTLFRNPFLKGRTRIHFTKTTLTRAVQIGLPISVEQVISGSSYVAFTRIVSSLGTVSIAANSFAITAESLCYMPGFGCASAATAIIGQCTGAGRDHLVKEISWRITRIGIIMMSLSGVAMFILAPYLMAILTPVQEVQNIGAALLRLEAFSEPMYGASIVINGILRGKGDTLWPSILNFASIWCVRIPLAALFSAWFGLFGAWIAMGIELNFRGIIFLLRLWHSTKNVVQAAS